MPLSHTHRLAKIVHPLAGGLATLLVAALLTITVVTELFGGTAAIVRVKTMIPLALTLVIPALILAIGSGAVVGARWRSGTATTKRRRSQLLAVNGAVVLLPAALFLAWKAHAGALDAAFYAVQAIEIAAGTLALALLLLNVRDGLRMSGRLTSPPRAAD